MTRVNYASTSPYSQTPQSSKKIEYLDFWNAPSIPFKFTDTLYRVEHKYVNRPDLLSFDYYNTTAYWWIFAMRNPDIIKDPIFDLKEGISIYLPDKQSLPAGI